MKLTFRDRIKEKMRSAKDDEELDEDFEAELDDSKANQDDGMSKVKEKKGFREQIKSVKKIIGVVGYEIGWYFDLIEKIFKVFSWAEPQTSDLILWLLVVAWVVVSYIPIRPFVALGLIGKFNTESKFYKRRYISNYNCSMIAIRNFFYHRKCYDFEKLYTKTAWHSESWPQ